jgi:hypothetical protein
MPPPLAQYKARHLKCIRNLRANITAYPPQRVQNTGAPRVGEAQPQRVDTPPLPRLDNNLSPLNSPTAPKTIHATPRIHQQHTRRNTPMPTIMEVMELHHLSITHPAMQPPPVPKQQPPFKSTTRHTSTPRARAKPRTINSQRIDSQKNITASELRKHISILVKRQTRPRNAPTRQGNKRGETKSK